MRRLGVIGCGRIALPVIRAVTTGVLREWDLVAVLARSSRPDVSPLVTNDPERFFSPAYDLIVEIAGPEALAQHGARALTKSDVWTTSGAALCDPMVSESLVAVGSEFGHRLRILSGALSGIDGVAMASAEGDAAVELAIISDRVGERVTFAGSAREVAVRFPNEVNVVVAAALAGPGLDATAVSFERDAELGRHEISLEVRSRFGEYVATSRPIVPEGSHPVAACVIAALRNETQVVWVG